MAVNDPVPGNRLRLDNVDAGRVSRPRRGQSTGTSVGHGQPTWPVVIGPRCRARRTSACLAGAAAHRALRGAARYAVLTTLDTTGQSRGGFATRWERVPLRENRTQVLIAATGRRQTEPCRAGRSRGRPTRERRGQSWAGVDRTSKRWNKRPQEIDQEPTCNSIGSARVQFYLDR